MVRIEYEAFRGESCFAAALNYLRLGWSVLGCCPPDHFGVGEAHKAKCNHPGKAPWGPWKVYQDRLPTEEEIARKFKDNPRLNVGVCLGTVSGIIRVDVDGEAGEVKLAEISGGDLPTTLEFVSGRANGGRGLLYRIPNGVQLKTTPLRTGQEKTELRFQARGAQTILPPSLHHSGCRYEWVVGRGPGEIEIAVMPDWAIEALKPTPPRNSDQDRGNRLNAVVKYVDAAVRAELAILSGTLEGGRNDQLNKSSFVLGQFVGAGVLGRAEIEEILLAAAVGIGLPLKEAAATIKSGLDSGVARPRDLTHTGRLGPPSPPSTNGTLHSAPDDVPSGREAPFTDVANARRFVARHGQNVRYCYPWRSWLHWTGLRWSLDQTGTAMRLAKDSVIQLLHSVHRELDQAIRQAHSSGAKPKLDQIDEMLDWAEKSHDIARLNALLDLARSEEGIPLLPADLDRDSWLLNCRNGTIDLRTGELREHCRSDLLTKLAPVAYDPTATAPTWMNFLNRIFAGNYDLIGYLKRAVGYSLTGDVSEQCLFFLYGDGANGKSTFLGAVQHVMGDYALQAVSDLLLAKQREQHPTERADLFGRRFVATIELDDGKKLAEALMKQLTGGDKIRARFMRKDFFEFDPTHKIFLAANHKPTIRGTDHANWRRIKLVPFSVTISDQDRDPHLLDKLKAEAAGILRWMVEGCLAWKLDGLGEPDEVRQATAEYRAEQDVVGRFLQERCCTGPDYRIRASDLYRDFTTWRENGGERIEMTQTAFGRTLTAKHFDRDTSNGVWYIGLALRHD